MQLIVIILMLTNQKRGNLYLSGAGMADADAAEAVPRRVFGGNPERQTTVLFFGVLSMEDRARCITSSGMGTAVVPLVAMTVASPPWTT
jgi:hypothetical protein